MKSVLLIVVVMLFIGCSKPVNLDKPSNALIADGRQYMQSKSYVEAAKVFEGAVLNSYEPTQAQMAQRLLGDAYFEGKKYIDAVAAYEVYYDLYRDDQNISIIVYKIATSYAKASYAPNRDTEFVEKSIYYCQLLRDKYPDTYIALEVLKTHNEMLEKMAEAEYRIAKYYVRIKEPESALTRFNNVIYLYPQSAVVQDSYHRVIKLGMKYDFDRYIIDIYLSELEKRFPLDPMVKEFEEKLNKSK